MKTLFKLALIPLLFALRVLDINRHLNTLFGKVELRFDNTSPKDLLGNKDISKTEAQIYVIEWYGFLLANASGIGMKMDDLVKVVTNIAEAPRSAFYGASFTLSHPTDKSLSYEIPAWAVGKLYKKAYKVCAAYQMVKTLQQQSQEYERQEAYRTTTGIEEEDLENQEEKPVIH